MNNHGSLKEVFIVPHTHWDREWYKPFQEFRFKLVGLVDKLIEILAEKEYYFTLDGQTVVLEDYFEIKPENKEKLLELVCKGKISVGPWYLLPDEWLVGQESIIRNLEMSIDLAKQLNIPQMKVGHLPDQFGHTRAIPQIISDLTDISCVIIWRGVGPEVKTVPFYWKSHKNAKKGILGNYLPHSYGNAATLPNQLDILEEDIKAKVDELQEFSPLPIYLLMNGTDHQYPQPTLIDLVPKLKLQGYKVKIALLQQYISRLQEIIKEQNYIPPTYSGEFRSSIRAPLLQDTYSARMWIKQWDNKVEDLLVHYVEPMSSYLHLKGVLNYPTGFIQTAWKWLLRNQPHDSICGCSIDQTHDEMKTRYSWAENIGDTLVEAVETKLNSVVKQGEDTYCLVFNPTNNHTLMVIDFLIPSKIKPTHVISEDGKKYLIQKAASSETVVFENIFKPFFLKNGVKMLQGRKLMDVFINGVEMIEDSSEPTLLHVTLILGKKLEGEFDTQQLKEQTIELVDTGKYKKFHVKASLGVTQSYNSVVPLQSWAFNKFTIGVGSELFVSKEFTASAYYAENRFYALKFNSHGTIDLSDKRSGTEYKDLHEFEDWGDRGDEYTFSRVGPQSVKISSIKRNIVNQGPLFCDIRQDCTLTIPEQLSEDRTKRIGKTKIPVSSVFRFYRDIPRIDVTTTLTNTAKDHRLRIGFNLPFTSKTSLTSTHFGFIERQGDAIKAEEYSEMPSGIQAQKRFIRVDEEKGSNSLTVFNKGLPEVELVNNSKIALTLMRSIGYLSRQDYPERPMHAGPADATPGAQELNTEYTFRYGFMAHRTDMPMNEIYNYAESFALPTKSFSFSNAEFNADLTKSLISIPESMIKISSMRIRDGKLLVLMYNIDGKESKINAQVKAKFQSCSEVLVDGTEKRNISIENGNMELNFDPFEIKLLRFN